MLKRKVDRLIARSMKSILFLILSIMGYNLPGGLKMQESPDGGKARVNIGGEDVEVSWDALLEPLGVDPNDVGEIGRVPKIIAEKTGLTELPEGLPSTRQGVLRVVIGDTVLRFQ